MALLTRQSTLTEKKVKNLVKLMKNLEGYQDNNETIPNGIGLTKARKALEAELATFSATPEAPPAGESAEDVQS